MPRFTASVTSDLSPLMMNFTGSSTGAIDSWFWEFGDGATSTDRNPTHTYTTVGVYSVALTVSGPGGEDTLAVDEFISVAPNQNPRDHQVYLPLVKKS